MENFERKNELSERELEQIVFLSFMFSQGSGILQERLLEAITYFSGPQDRERVKQAFEKLSSKLLTGEGKDTSLSEAKIHAGGERIRTGVESQLYHLASLEYDVLEEPDFRHIVAGIWDADYHYLCESEGRPNRNTSFKADSIQDPFFSFGIHYLLRHNETGNKQFNLLLEKLRDVTEINDSAKITVIKKYNETHPDTPL